MDDNKNKWFSFIFIILIISVVIVSTVSVGVLIDKVSNEDHAKFALDTTLLVLSSVLSAVVAYIVSMLQINKEKKNQLVEYRLNNHRCISLLVIEMEDNLDVLSRIKDSKCPNGTAEILNSQISKIMWNKLIHQIDVTEEVLMNLLKTEKKLVLLCKQTDGKKIEATFSSFYYEYQSTIEELKKLLEKNKLLSNK